MIQLKQDFLEGDGRRKLDEERECGVGSPSPLREKS